MSETLGSLIDKLSVVNLKIWHQEEIAHDSNVLDEEIASTKRSINILNNQRNDLIEEIDELFLDVLSGKRKMKVFHQFKDYRQRK